MRADLVAHFAAGVLAGAVGASAVAVLGVVLGEPGLRLAMPGAAVLGALVAGVAKEAFDWMRLFWTADLGKPVPPPDVSAADVVATVLGGAVVAVPVFLAVWGGR